LGAGKRRALAASRHQQPTAEKQSDERAKFHPADRGVSTRDVCCAKVRGS
jgi:hypothetical protein